ncbi:RNA polymerase factor sigma-54 [Litchfieldia salsa]|uniref:RNA polymerase, sigma 54 subunit, RpoN/SigL n=1 Tax=Litchfieldia salsa TaxID=930152 RepID=A0A1H0WCN9_9BACI|nr:RNA polymerase factor sigma-54 [Litchfieldia salsa]SDP88076.1 RNA polymerase, sigma 54 subunit, RpoN/SigL [Litchfieldia salsa]
MEIKAGLFQKQSLKLSMTKELTQAITLLQYSSIELQDFLQQLSLENPLMELKERSYSNLRVGGVSKKPIDYIGKNVLSLSDHLCMQLVNFDLSHQEQIAVKYVIASLDDNGYLLQSEKELATSLGINIEIVTKTIDVIQQLDPVGVGARNLQECLLLQLFQKPDTSPLATEVIDQYFEPFANKSWKEISTALRVDVKEIQKVYDLVQQLNPRPGSQFQHWTTSYIKPEVKIEVVKGEVLFTLLAVNTTQLSLNKQYSNLRDINPEAKSFLEEKYNQYLWIEKSIEQRKQTILKVMTEIIKKQRSFFIKGPMHIQPLTMSDVAVELGIHESTVSRAARGKYVQTPYGTFEIKSFFSNQVNDKSSVDLSSIQLKSLIKDIIEKENKQKPLSDQQLVSLLEQEYQVVVSRRTIAKYRDQLGIQGSNKRKRY